MNNRTILQGDVSKKIKEIPDQSIDLICTDPPYGYSFMNKDWDKVVISSNVWKECLRVLKPGSFAFVMSAPRQDVLCRVMINLEKAGFVMGFTSIYWAYASGFPKAMNVSKAVDKKLGFEPEVIGINEEFKKKNIANVKSGLSNMNKNMQLKGVTASHAGYQHPETIGNITKPTSEQAKQLDGSYAGFQPKPALEVILVCMKPLSEKNYVEQALSNGKGVTWLDDCRIPYKNEDDLESRKRGELKTDPLGRNKIYGEMKPIETDQYINNKGRFPANLIVSDNALDVGKKTKSSGGALGSQSMENKGYGFKQGVFAGQTGYGDEGDFSRYYSLDSWEARFLVTPKPSKSEKNEGLKQFTGKQVNDGRNIPPDNAFQRGKTVRQNVHPTVKPVELFKYLISMGSRDGDYILDPFMGSGTTAIACEKLARNWIGIEINPEYSEIITARIDKHRKQERLF